MPKPPVVGDEKQKHGEKESDAIEDNELGEKSYVGNGLVQLRHRDDKCGGETDDSSYWSNETIRNLQ
jgi:hypothetical protein